MWKYMVDEPILFCGINIEFKHKLLRLACSIVLYLSVCLSLLRWDGPDKEGWLTLADTLNWNYIMIQFLKDLTNIRTQNMFTFWSNYCTFQAPTILGPNVHCRCSNRPPWRAQTASRAQFIWIRQASWSDRQRLRGFVRRSRCSKAT